MGIIVESVGQYKSTLNETARNLFRSRNTQRTIAEQKTQQAEDLRNENEQLRRKLRESEERHNLTQQLLLQQQQENEQLRKQPVRLPADLPLRNHTYGPRMIALCMNLSKHIGFRPTETALNIVFEWLGIKTRIPSFSATRIWMCRAGIAQLQKPVVGDDWIWFSDHSNQIGQEKILEILGIRESDLPPLGQTLPLSKMRTLANIPGMKLGQTRNHVQQTELGHFTPSSQKPKARFMNLGPSLRWGKMVSYHLSHHRSKSRKGIKAARMNAKLGWVRGFRDELAAWNRCEEVMQASLSFINRQGIYRGAAAEMEVALNAVRKDHPADCHLSATMASELTTFVRESELLIAKGDRAWLSTENLESFFGRFKGLEGQHSKGGFTSLIAAMPALTIDWTPELVRESLSSVSVKQMNEWVCENLGTTMTSKRATAYKEAKQKNVV